MNRRSFIARLASGVSAAIFVPALPGHYLWKQTASGLVTAERQLEPVKEWTEEDLASEGFGYPQQDWGDCSYHGR